MQKEARLEDLKFFTRLKEQLAAVPDKYRNPEVPPVQHKTERVVGTLPDALQPLWCLLNQIDGEIKEAQAAHEREHDEFEQGGEMPDCTTFHVAKDRKGRYMGSLKTLLLESIRAELDLDTDKFGLREGNKIVVPTQDNEEEEALRELFGAEDDEQARNPLAEMLSRLGLGGARVITLGGGRR